jgi:microsomal dipeptidase-like Zn-dependent dipeptidase
VKRAVWVLAALLVLAGAFFFVVPREVEGRMNRVLHAPPYAASERARELHQRLLVADLHADSLLWNRDLLQRGTRGQVDVPRLIEGKVALQAFTIVTKTPRGLNLERNDDRTDNIFWLALSQRWPVRTWGSLRERAVFQAQKLQRFAARSGGKLVLVRTAGELRQYLERRRRESGLTAGLLGVEGAHALEGRLENLDVLYDAGVRTMAPTHFFDTEIAGSAAGVAKGGLTPLGREWVRRMEARRMIVDLAHASPRTLDDVLAMATRPVIVSHSGVRGVCDNQRNLSDEHVRGVARSGGLVGIGYWKAATCGEDARAIARSIRYAADLAGIDHVALGSDFDGAITAPFDTTGLVQVTDALLTEGFGEDEVAKIMGANVLRVLEGALP